VSATVVIGVGNEYRRDDGLGLTVVRLLQDKGLPDVEFAECDGEPSRLIELWSRAELAIVVDAVHTDPTQPGAVHRLNADHPSGAPAGATSSHGVDLGEAVALARVLDRLPRRLLVFAVEVADTSYGRGLSPDVAAAAEQVADEITTMLA
jgi:hydrogenase maturation protease